jgi:NADH:ubiquinone oxidoreductase subunit 5 (subunit L)/multisubunit Na+/H+ antiporter MnhA subunit
VIDELLLLAIAGPLLLALLLALRLVTGERAVAYVAQSAAAFSAATSAIAVGLWIANSARPLLTPPHVLFKHEDYRFTFQLALDEASVVFLVLVQFTTGMVLRFSRFYLHREPGFRRFFATVLMFQAAMCVLTLAANLDLMFAGWEMVGCASFLLIAFYWERQSAVRNALKTYSVYRIADMGMLLAACLAERADHRLLGLLLLLAAMGKSAQFPFSFWVPRAMEGPTPSSALFYGALSVHAGAYLLLRTEHFWGDVTVVRVFIGAVGLVTATLCSMFSRVQPTIKGQVGYASVTQVGLIFVELALGLRALALVHMVCNALLRCYQLLVSPSVVAYLVRRQASAGFAQASEWRSGYGRLLPETWASPLYVFALSEGYLKEAVKVAIWGPLRHVGRAVLPWRAALLALSALGLTVAVALAPRTSQRWDLALGWTFITQALLCSASGLGSWRKPLRAVAWVSLSSVAVAAAVFVISPAHNSFAGIVYAGAVVVLCGLGLVGTRMVVSPRAEVGRFAGLSEKDPLATALALVSALGIAGFPLLPTFLGEDLLLHDALPNGGAVSALITAVLALNGYLAVRNFAFTFLGPHRSVEGGAPAGVTNDVPLEEWTTTSSRAA